MVTVISLWYGLLGKEGNCNWIIKTNIELDELTHCGRVTQICVFNTRLVSTQYTLNYAIHRAFLRMFPLTDVYTRVGTLIVATIYLQLIQNRYMFRSFTALHCTSIVYNPLPAMWKS